ncbi:zinc finger protein GLI2 [Rhypophila decipiens]
MLSSTGSGMFSFCQTGPADLQGSWDTAAEGQQNYAEFPDAVDYYAGDAEDYVLPFGQITPKPDHMDAMDDLHARWTPAAAVEAKAPKGEPMRRVTSRSSTGSHKHRSSKLSSASSKKGRSRVQSILSSAQMSKLDMTGNASAYQDGSVTDGRMMDVQQYLAQDLDSLSVSPHVNGPAFYSGMMGYPDGLSYTADLGASMVQHVNPQVFDTGLQGHSPHSWGSLSPGDSRMSSPGVLDGVSDDMWSAVPSASSPGGSQNSSSPPFPGQSPRMSRKLDASQYVAAEDMHGNMVSASAEDAFSLPPPFSSRRLSGEGESARDHYLYKNVQPDKTDGLFHCPWEGQASCNHKPEKLKCNYDKFVDSHLKPYRCKVEGCQNARFSSTACLLRHEREAHAMHGHGEKPYLCTYEGCERSLPGHGFPRQWNLRDHMRRVHNDNGAPVQPTSPPSSGSNTASRGRKRKTDSQEKQSSQDKASGRKSSKASQEAAASAAKAAEAQANAEIDAWWNHQKALQSLVQEYCHPDDPQSLQYIKDAQDHLTAMGKISHELVASNKAEVLQRPYGRSFKG